jgi:hypothetical protein
MKEIKRKYILVILAVVSLAGCIPFSIGTQTITPTNTVPIVPTSMEKPEYLVGFGPKGITKLSDYKQSLDRQAPDGRGVGVVIDKSRICISGDDDRYLNCGSERIKIYVDNQILSNDTLLIGEGGYYYYSWAPVLGSGMHTVRFTFTRDSGEVLEFSWQFYLTED